MPAATTKDQLLAVSEKEWGKLAALIAELPEDIALAKDSDAISIKDVIAHRAHWIGLFFGWHDEGQAGRSPAIPAPGYKWSELKRYNTDLRARQAGLGWHAARDALRRRHDALIAFLQARPEQALYGGPMPGGSNKWTTGRWAEAAGASHYRSAAKYIRARKKALSDPA